MKKNHFLFLNKLENTESCSGLKPYHFYHFIITTHCLIFDRLSELFLISWRFWPSYYMWRTHCECWPPPPKNVKKYLINDIYTIYHLIYTNIIYIWWQHNYLSLVCEKTTVGKTVRKSRKIGNFFVIWKRKLLNIKNPGKNVTNFTNRLWEKEHFLTVFSPYNDKNKIKIKNNFLITL